MLSGGPRGAERVDIVSADVMAGKAEVLSGGPEGAKRADIVSTHVMAGAGVRKMRAPKKF